VRPAPPLLPVSPAFEATQPPHRALPASRPLPSSALMEPMLALWYDSPELNWKPGGCWGME
jgi:hypothetical protein